MGSDDRLGDTSGRAYFVDDWGIEWGKDPYYDDMIYRPLENLDRRPR